MFWFTLSVCGTFQAQLTVAVFGGKSSKAPRRIKKMQQNTVQHLTATHVASAGYPSPEGSSLISHRAWMPKLSLKERES